MPARNNIIHLPNRLLRQPSKKVGLVDGGIKNVVKKMQEATLDWEAHRKHEVGVALAAIQISEGLKIVIVREDSGNKSSRGFQVFINPEITKRYGDIVEDYEGCLSIPDIYGKVPRHSKVKVKAKGLDGREFRVNAGGFTARVLQHEIDHCKGKLFIDHIKDKPDAFFKLDEEGKLKPLDYEKDIKQNNILWQ